MTNRTFTDDKGNKYELVPYSVNLSASPEDAVARLCVELIKQGVL